MVEFVKTMVESFPSKYLRGAKVSMQFNEKLFTVNIKGRKLIGRKTIKAITNNRKGQDQGSMKEIPITIIRKC